MTGTKTNRSARSGIGPNKDVLFIGGIPRGASQSNMRNFFQNLVGNVKKVRFVIDRTTRSHRGFGFARFNDEATAQKVLEIAKAEGGLLFRGKIVNVGCSEHSVMSGSSDSASSTHSPGEEDDLSDLPELEDDVDLDEETASSESTPVAEIQQPVHMPVQPIGMPMQPVYTMYQPVYPVQQYCPSYVLGFPQFVPSA